MQYEGHGYIPVKSKIPMSCSTSFGVFSKLLSFSLHGIKICLISNVFMSSVINILKYSYCDGTSWGGSEKTVSCDFWMTWRCLLPYVSVFIFLRFSQHFCNRVIILQIFIKGLIAKIGLIIFCTRTTQLQMTLIFNRLSMFI